MDTDRRTTAQQETMLGQGLAVGCLSLGVTAVTSDKAVVEESFTRTWEHWPLASIFPSIQFTEDSQNLVGILAGSAGRRRHDMAHWSCEGDLHPQLGPQWSLEEAGDVLDRVTGVPHSAWTELADAFVHRLGSERIRCEKPRGHADAAPRALALADTVDDASLRERALLLQRLVDELSPWSPAGRRG